MDADRKKVLDSSTSSLQNSKYKCSCCLVCNKVIRFANKTEMWDQVVASDKFRKDWLDYAYVVEDEDLTSRVTGLLQASEVYYHSECSSMLKTKYESKLGTIEDYCLICDKKIKGVSDLWVQEIATKIFVQKWLNKYANQDLGNKISSTKLNGTIYYHVKCFNKIKRDHKQVIPFGKCCFICDEELKTPKSKRRWFQTVLSNDFIDEWLAYANTLNNENLISKLKSETLIQTVIYIHNNCRTKIKTRYHDITSYGERKRGTKEPDCIEDKALNKTIAYIIKNIKKKSVHIFKLDDLKILFESTLEELSSEKGTVDVFHLRKRILNRIPCMKTYRRDSTFVLFYGDKPEFETEITGYDLVPSDVEQIYCKKCTSTSPSHCIICQISSLTSFNGDVISLTREQRKLLWKYGIQRKSLDNKNHLFYHRLFNISNEHFIFTNKNYVVHVNCFNDLTNEEDLQNLILSYSEHNLNIKKSEVSTDIANFVSMESSLSKTAISPSHTSSNQQPAMMIGSHEKDIEDDSISLEEEEGNDNDEEMLDINASREDSTKSKDINHEKDKSDEPTYFSKEMLSSLVKSFETRCNKFIGNDIPIYFSGQISMTTGEGDRVEFSVDEKLTKSCATLLSKSSMRIQNDGVAQDEAGFDDFDKSNDFEDSNHSPEQNTPAADEFKRPKQTDSNTSIFSSGSEKSFKNDSLLSTNESDCLGREIAAPKQLSEFELMPNVKIVTKDTLNAVLDRIRVPEKTAGPSWDDSFDTNYFPDPIKVEKEEQIQSSSNDQEYFCFHCKFEMTVHGERLVQALTDIPVFECEVCKSKLRTLACLNKHDITMHKHLNVTVLQCKICSKTFSRKSFLDNHTKNKTCTKYVKTIFSCDLCGKTFNGSSRVSFKETDLLRNHISKHLDERSFKCDICPATFNDLGGLKMHKKRMHSGVQHICDICGKVFTSVSLLNDHVKVRHLELRRHSCNVCGKKFKTKGVFENHKRIHTGEKPHACQVCGQKFRASISLKYHTQYKHTGERPFSCEICSKGFVQKQVLQGHMKTHHSMLHS